MEIKAVFILFIFLHVPSSQRPYVDLKSEGVKRVVARSSVEDYVMTPSEAEEFVGMINSLSHYGYVGESESRARFILEYVDGRTEYIGVERPGNVYYLIKNGKAYEMGEETGKQLHTFHSAYVAMRYEKSATRPYGQLDDEEVESIMIRTPEGDYGLTSSEREEFVTILNGVSHYGRALYYGSSDAMFVMEYTDGRKDYIGVVKPWYFIVNGAAYEIELDTKERIEEWYTAHNRD